MRKISFSLVYFWAVVMLFTACENKTPESEKSSEVPSEQIVSQADSILRNVDIQWTELEHADNALLENSQTLADKIAELDGLNKELYDSIPILIEEVKKYKYDQTSMSDSMMIENFDVSVTNLVSAVQRLQQTTAGGKDCVVCDGIFEVIADIDNSYVVRRHKYDQEVAKFNTYVSENKDALGKADAEKYKELPYFTIPVE